MTLLRAFWDAAVALDPAAEPRHERHMPSGRRHQLSALWAERGLQEIEETALVIPMEFASFDALWAPFLKGQGPGGAYVASLTPDRRQALRERLRQELSAGGSHQPIRLAPRARA